MNKNGAFYVPDAELIKPNLKLLTDFALARSIPIIGSLDAHTENDPEFKIFPRHCVKGTAGQRKIPETRGRGKYFEKQSCDVFTNPEFEAYIRYQGVKEAVVYGVATDFCVKAAVLGMQQRGIECYVVEDAIKGVFPESTKKALEEMARAGAKLVTTKQVLEGRL
jgi:nicotinamidase/pyrazinamidase